LQFDKEVKIAAGKMYAASSLKMNNKNRSIPNFKFGMLLFFFVA